MSIIRYVPTLIVIVHVSLSQSWIDRLGKKPAPCPQTWRSILGEYQSKGDTVYLFEKDGQLALQTKRGVSTRLDPMSDDLYGILGTELFGQNTVIITKRAKTFDVALRFGPREFVRILTGGEGETTFRITPLRPVDELRKEALKAQPPKETGVFVQADLVELTKLDSTIKLDIRYASANNFAGEPFYSQAKAFMQRPAAEALVRAHRNLRRLGYGLLIHDAYRPWYVTKMFWEATPDDKKIFVADPSKGSRHNRGCAVDATLYELPSGKPVAMPSGYDEFSERAYPSYPGGTSLERWHRELLRRALEEEGFAVYEWEWWHFDYKDWQKYPIGTLTFEEIEGRK
jgi:D-alanyl-D-alanine dipeptidase